MFKRKSSDSSEMRALPSVPMRELDRKFMKELKELRESNEELRHSNEILQKKVDRMELWILSNFGGLDQNDNCDNSERDDDYQVAPPLDPDCILKEEDEMEYDETFSKRRVKAEGNKIEGINDSLSCTRLKIRRNELNLEDKVSVIRLCEEEHLSHRAIAKQFNIGKTQVGNILKLKCAIKEAYAKFLKDEGGLSGSQKQIPSRIDKSGEHRHSQIINARVKQYYDDRLALGFYTSGPQLQAKARELAVENGVAKFNASGGWLHHFLKKYQIKLGSNRHSIESSASASTSSATFSALLAPVLPDTTMEDVEATKIKVEYLEMTLSPNPHFSSDDFCDQDL